MGKISNIEIKKLESLYKLNKLAFDYISKFGMGSNLNITSHNYKDYLVSLFS